MTRIHTVTDKALADALSATSGIRYLAPFFERARSVSQACDYLGEPMSRMHYWARRWLDLGALEVAFEQPRAGRSIAFYRTTADEFLVPDALLSETLLARQMDHSTRELLRALEASVPQIARAGMLKIYQDAGQHGVTMDRSSLEDPGASRRTVSMHMSSTLVLTTEESLELFDELIQLRDRWLERSAGRKATGRGRHLRSQHLVLSTVPKPVE